METTHDEETPLPTKEEVKELNLDAPTRFLGLTLRQIYDWEARHRQFCKLAHRQPCNCSAWD